MRCPTCDADLVDCTRLGVRAGYCPRCEGEWFAGGAVDRMLDRAIDPARTAGLGRMPSEPGADRPPAVPGPPATAGPSRPRAAHEETWDWF